MATSTYVDLDEKGKSVNESRYRGMVGSLFLKEFTPYNLNFNLKTQLYEYKHTSLATVILS